MLQAWTDEETLPNGVYVCRKTSWHECKTDYFPVDKPWLASINIRGFHYSNRGSATKEQAVIDLFEYMQDKKRLKKAG